ncbi:hypothetical protein ACFY1P_00910 [Streptomyces sp. NPDC001407]|uniref:hypothetical protein n=1 Tax=unclassified Streptomyces TaxID=2593676 RepID=UPI0033D04ABB
MFGTGKRSEQVLVLRDSKAIAEAVSEALAGATDEQRPGLELAAELIARYAERPEREVREEWTRGVLAKAGVDPRTHEVHAVKAVRQAQPGLSLAQAVQLVREVLEEGSGTAKSGA